MRTKSEVYYTRGEFAKLCGTTKETLRHYDSIGLLKPERKGENGYGYYTIHQFFDFDLIDTLKETGSSLKEIKEYLNHHNAEYFLTFLREREKKLAQESDRIKKMQEFLKRAIKTTEYALKSPYRKPSLIWCKEEYLIVIGVEEKENITLAKMIEKLKAHFTYLNERGLGEEFLVGCIVKKETILAGKDYESYYYTRLPEKEENERLFIKPEGLYVTMLHKGDYKTIPESYEIMKNYMKEHHLKICGNSYEYDLVTHLAVEDTNDFVIQISIQVEEE